MFLKLAWETIFVYNNIKLCGITPQKKHSTAYMSCQLITIFTSFFQQLTVRVVYIAVISFKTLILVISSTVQIL